MHGMAEAFVTHDLRVHEPMPGPQPVVPDQRLLSLALVAGLSAQLFLLVHLQASELRAALAVVMAAHLGVAWLVLRKASPRLPATGSQALASTLHGIAQTLHETQPAAEPAPATPRRPPAPLGWQVEALCTVPGLEMAAALRRLQGDAQVYQQRLRAFVQAHSHGLAPWRAWIDTTQWAELEEAAHRLQFLAGEIGARKIQAAALRLEMQIASEDSLGAHACLPALQEEVRELLTALNRAAQTAPAGASHASSDA